MLASGDPVGDPEAWPGAMAVFLKEAQAHAWTPAVIGCSEKAGQVWCRHTGFAALELGDEAVVDVDTFTLEGRAMRNVRQMVKRIERAGYTTDVVRARDVSDGERRRALADAAAWRSSETERGFSMALGRVIDPPDPDCVWVVARQDGVMRAFLQFVPWGADGMSLDLMRRDRTAEPGVNELLIVHALAKAPGPRRQARVAELRRVPLCPRAGRAPRRRPGHPRLAADPAVRLALVPDREPLPLQRQVPADLGAAVPGLPAHRRPPADRDGGTGGRGVPHLAVAALVRTGGRR